MFNALKNGLIGFFLGQTAVLLMKDKAIKEKIKKSDGIEKIKAIYEALIQTNKNLMDEIKSIDYATNFETIKNSIEKEIGVLEKKVQEITKKKLDKKTLKKLVENLKKEVVKIEKAAGDQLKNIDTDFQISKKFKSIKKKLETIK